MLGAFTSDAVSGTLVLLITCCPLSVLAIMLWQWQKELSAASRLRRANAWARNQSGPE
jgi:hypothetical protein